MFQTDGNALQLIVFVSALGVLGCDVVDAVDARDEEIQFAYIGSYYDVLTDATRRGAGRTVAAIQHFQTHAGAENYNCGSTFLAPHFAVTAAHCVDNLVAGGLLPAGTFLVRTFDAVDMDVADALAHAYVDTSDGWPNWESGSTFDYVNIAGLAVTTLECRVYCRRDGCWDTVYANGVIPDGLTRFQLNTLSVAVPDVAIIECPGRTETFIAGVASDPNPDPMAIKPTVETRWFHEVVNLNVGNFSSPDWQRYGFYNNQDIPSNSTNNYHYTWPHLLLALRTNKSVNGDAARLALVNTVANPAIMGASVGTSIVADLPGCHGTSGSAVFGAGSSYMYGTVQNPRGVALQSRGPIATSNELCSTQLNAAHPWTIRQFNRMTRLVNDRNGTYTPSF